MRLALMLAARARLTARPNPMVGSVVVGEGRILGRGYHVAPGKAHGEAAAVADAVARHGADRVRGASVYINLEPCSFTGRTPPCADMLVDHGVGRVVCAIEDPDARVSGSGFARLREAGVLVEVGLLAAEAERLNRAYLTQRRTGRPLVTMKAAQSLDGTIATASGDSKWITGPAARARGHALRAEAQAIVVGVGTVIADNPALTVRHVTGQDPLRVILDSELRTPADARAAGAGSLIVTTERAPSDRRAELEQGGAEVAVVEADADGKPRIDATLRLLGDREIIHVLVEGGGRTHTAFLRANVVDRLAMFVAPSLLGSGVPSVGDLGTKTVAGRVRLSHVETYRLGEDLLVTADVQTEGA